MQRRLTSLGLVVGALVVVPVAQADHWPMAGGNPSRSANASHDPGQAPITPAWSAPDGAVRTPIVVTGGGGADRQRVAYGTADGFVHLRVLETGAPVGPAEGIDIDGGSINDDGKVFGSGAIGVGFADTSTEGRLGQLFVVHNDDPVAAAAVFTARFDLATGDKVSEEIVSGTAQCSVNGSPLLTPVGPGGSRILYFMLVCPLYRHLVRVPILGDATSRDAVMGPPGFATIVDATETASPTLVVLRDASGSPHLYAGVARRGGLSFFSADQPFDAAPANVATPPAITAEFADASEVAETASVPTTDDGLVAGFEGSGTGPAPAVFVAARAASDAKVYRFVQDANAQVLRADKVVGLPGAGAPAAAMAVAEQVRPTGPSDGGRLLVSSVHNATLLRTTDLSVVARLSSAPLPAGSGFARAAPAVSGDFAYLVRDGNSETVAEHLALRLDGLAPLSAPAFARAGDPAKGAVAGQPAFSNGRVVFGTARGPFAYVTREVAPPEQDDQVLALPPSACAEDLIGSRRADRLKGTAKGERILGGAGNDRLDGRGGSDCVFGQAGRDRLTGGSGDDLLEGGPGADVLSDRAGSNAINGGSGADRLRGGPGPDRLSGGPGNDRIDGGRGEDTIDAGSGNDVVTAVDGRRDGVACGKGRDRVTADRVDVVAASCERVVRVRRRAGR